jgi:hypothetical protein
MYTRMVHSEYKNEMYQKEWISVVLFHSIMTSIKYGLGGGWYTLEYEWKDSTKFNYY